MSRSFLVMYKSANKYGASSISSSVIESRVITPNPTADTLKEWETHLWGQDPSQHINILYFSELSQQRRF